MTTSAYEQGFMDAFTAYAVKCATIQSTKLVPSTQNSTDPSKVNEGVIPGTTPAPKFAKGAPQFGTANLQVGKTKKAEDSLTSTSTSYNEPQPGAAASIQTPMKAPAAPVAPPKTPAPSAPTAPALQRPAVPQPSAVAPKANPWQTPTQTQERFKAQSPTAPPAKPVQTPIQAAAPKAPAKPAWAGTGLTGGNAKPMSVSMSAPAGGRNVKGL